VSAANIGHALAMGVERADTSVNANSHMGRRYRQEKGQLASCPFLLHVR